MAAYMVFFNHKGVAARFLQMLNHETSSGDFTHTKESTMRVIFSGMGYFMFLTKIESEQFPLKSFYENNRLKSPL